MGHSGSLLGSGQAWAKSATLSIRPAGADRPALRGARGRAPTGPILASSWAVSLRSV